MVSDITEITVVGTSLEEYEKLTGASLNTEKSMGNRRGKSIQSNNVTGCDVD